MIQHVLFFKNKSLSIIHHYVIHFYNSFYRSLVSPRNNYKLPHSSSSCSFIFIHFSFYSSSRFHSFVAGGETVSSKDTLMERILKNKRNTAGVGNENSHGPRDSSFLSHGLLTTISRLNGKLTFWPFGRNLFTLSRRNILSHWRKNFFLRFRAART